MIDTESRITAMLEEHTEIWDSGGNTHTHIAPVELYLVGGL